MEALKFELPYPPSVNRYWRVVPIHRGFRVVLSRDGRAYRREACARLAALGAPQLDGPLAVVVTLRPPDRRKRDADNALKGICDALQHAGVILDDAQIEDLRVIKAEQVKGGAAAVEIREKR